MANTFNFADWVAAEGLRMLINDLVIASEFNTDYNREFTKSFAVGSTVRVPLPQRFNVTTGLGYQPQPLDRPFTTVTCDQIFGIHFEMDSVDMALKMERGREMFKTEYLDKAISQMAQEIDSRAAQWAYLHTSNIVGVLGTNSTDTSIAGSARQRLIEQACPPGNKIFVTSPSNMTGIVNGSTTIFNPMKEISNQYKEGAVGHARGFDWYESMSLYQSTAGVWQTPASVTVHGANQSGSSISINDVAGDTFVVGDVINFAGVLAVNPLTRRSTGTLKQFVVTQPLTGTGTTGADLLQIQPPIIGPGSHYQNVDSLPANAALLTLYPGTTTPSTGPKSGTNGLALHRDAFALVGVPLDIPQACEMSSRSRDPKTGISMAFVQMFDPILRRRINRLDCLMGFGDLYFDNASVRVLSA